jgi:hypothetical protein
MRNRVGRHGNNADEESTVLFEFDSRTRVYGIAKDRGSIITAVLIRYANPRVTRSVKSVEYGNRMLGRPIMRERRCRWQRRLILPNGETQFAMISNFWIEVKQSVDRDREDARAVGLRTGKRFMP